MIPLICNKTFCAQGRFEKEDSLKERKKDRKNTQVIGTLFIVKFRGSGAKRQHPRSCLVWIFEEHPGGEKTICGHPLQQGITFQLWGRCWVSNSLLKSDGRAWPSDAVVQQGHLSFLKTGTRFGGKERSVGARQASSLMSQPKLLGFRQGHKKWMYLVHERGGPRLQRRIRNEQLSIFIHKTYYFVLCTFIFIWLKIDDLSSEVVCETSWYDNRSDSELFHIHFHCSESPISHKNKNGSKHDLSGVN